MVVKDHLLRDVNISGVPKRVVSLVPSQTELLSYLGLEETIVGVTKFCVHPSHLRKSKTVVGGTKKVRFEKIKLLEPDLILCNKEENTKEMVAELEKIAPVHISDIVSLNDAFRLITDYGIIFQKVSEAENLLSILEKERHGLKDGIKTKGLKVAYLIWRKPWMVAGKNTFINHLLELNGWANVIEDQQSRYPQIEIQDLKFLNPDIIFLSSEPYPFKEKHIGELRENFINARVILVDGEFFSWYGSRLIPAFSYFRELQIKLSISL